MILVTGGAGFIGSNFVLDWIARGEEGVVNLDKLTYAGNLENLRSLEGNARHLFVRGDIGDQALVGELLALHRPRAVVNFAAESHVDRSIHGPGTFIETNVLGTFRLLEAARVYFDGLRGAAQERFRFLHVSTDEVYGSLAPADPAFTERRQYEPNSPYSASKAASDHLVRAYHRTYGLPVLTTNGSNTHGPFQSPEKLIPLMIVNALAGKPLPVYGDGQHVRDWMHVADHCSALVRVLEAGSIGETYNVGGWNEKPNIDIVRTICRLLDELRPRADGASYAGQIAFVQDRPGHDRRYAVDARKMERELGWRPAETFETGIRKTVQWYLDHTGWVQRAQGGSYREWMATQYAPGGMKILLFGRNGQVGWELQRSLAPLGELVALDRAGSDGLCGDLADAAGVARTVLQMRPQVVVNAAAYTAVDQAESEPELAHAINAVAPGALAEAACEVGAALVHYSTEHVFDGSGSRPWRETDPTDPLGVYGRSKLEGEQRIAAALPLHLILRTSWVYAARGGNFALTMLRLAREREQLSVVADQVGAPTGADLLADVTAQALRPLLSGAAPAGCYHVAAAGETSRHGYARFVVEQAEAAGVALKAGPAAVLPIASTAFPTPARRPHNSRLDTTRFRATFGLTLPPWEHGVARMLQEILPTP